jgi:3-deoxy-D-manno-octulosonic-acid transferase
MRSILAHVDLFLMQTEEDARRIVAIGGESAHVSVCGNLKYDVPLPDTSPLAAWLENSLARAPRRPVLVAGSVVAGEESAVLEAFAAVRAGHPCALLIFAPRRPERFDFAAQFAADSGFRILCRSRLDLSTPFDDSVDVLILDSIGELAGLYRLADLAFVGGSLVSAGGHNILEPAAAGVPVLFGPSMENFTEVSRLVLNVGAGLQVRDAEDLGRSWLALLRDPARRSAIGRAAFDLMERNRGAAARVLDRIATLLDQVERAP